MPTYGMAVDLDRCTGCYNCQLACKDEHVGNDFPPITASQPTFGHFWLSIEEREQCWDSSHYKVTYIAKPCQQCDNAPCLKAAKDGAVYRRPDGIVIIDPRKAVGQKQLVDACPYGTIYWNEEKNLPQKCTFCAHLVDDQWTQPRCVQSCPMNCMHFGDLADPNSDVSRFLAGKKPEFLHPEFDSKPKVCYVGLPKPHLAGTVRFADSGDCAAGVKVTLTGPDGTVVETVTDHFGDFAFSDVKQGKQQIAYAVPGYEAKLDSFSISGDITDLAEISLAKVAGAAQAK